MRIIFTLTIFFLFVPIVLTQKGVPQLDIPALLRDFRRNLHQYEGIYDYTFTQKRIIRIFDKRGNLKNEKIEIFEAYPTKNRRNLVLVKISENGVPLAKQKIAAERERAVKQLEEAERRKQSEPQVKERDESGYVQLGFDDFLRAGEFVNPRRERYGESDTLVLDFRPRPDFRPATRMETVVSNLNGSIWINEEKKQVIRLEAYPKDDGYKASSTPIGIIHPNSAIVMEQKPTAEGIWLLALWHMDTVSRPALFNKTEINMTFEFSNYQRFNTNIQNYELNAPKPKS